MKIINQIREYKKHHTDSELYLPDHDDRFCYVLEDAGRPNGVKVQAETCIPEGVYRVEISRSNRFKKDMILLYNQEDKSVYRYGARFTGVRVHGGNSIDNTEGCPLANYHSDGEGKAWGRASDDILAKIREWNFIGHVVLWVISSIEV